MLNDLFEGAKRVGFHGAIGLAVILAVVFVVAYGFVQRPDHDLTARAFTVLEVGAGGLIVAAIFKLRGE